MIEMVMTVGPKGQVVIPKQIRDIYGIVPADKVIFREEKEGVLVMKPKSVAVDVFERIAFSGKQVAIDVKELKKQFFNEFSKVKLK